MFCSYVLVERCPDSANLCTRTVLVPLSEKCKSAMLDQEKL